MSARRILNNWLWVCPVLSLVIAIALPLLLGFGLWTAALVAVFLACPIAAAWTLVAERLNRREGRKT
jgi:uncharacterized membrane protein